MVSIFFLLQKTRLLVIIYVASYEEINYIKGPLLPVCELDDVAVMFGQANLEFLSFLQRLIKVSMVSV